MENPYHISFWSSIGSNPTPMAFSEVYIGLQQNTIDAQENPYEVIVSNKFYEQQDYVIQTNHLPHLLSLITNKGFLEGLTTKQQDIIKEAAATARDYSREQALKRADERIDVCQKGGAQMREASKALYEQIRTAVDDDTLYNMYVSGN